MIYMLMRSTLVAYIIQLVKEYTYEIKIESRGIRRRNMKNQILSITSEKYTTIPIRSLQMYIIS